MNGQWIGTYSGSNKGNLIANIDEFPQYFEGLIYLDEADPNLPSTSVLIRTSNKESKQQFTSLNIAPINPFTGSVDSWENVKKHYTEPIVIPAVMNDLSRMGITAGSLFPGLDGACEELKERNFIF
jgi:hypothetical protein